MSNLLPQASTIARSVDLLTLSLLAICGTVAIGVFVTIIYFVIRYREGTSVNRTLQKRGGWMLELFWMAVPLGIFIILFLFGAYTYLQMHSVPPNAMPIFVTGKQWMWKFQHGDGLSEKSQASGVEELGELHVPVGRPVELIMTSQDVVHSFFVPAFRIKQDVLPGRDTHTWFQATRIGQYRIYCSQYCGTFHSTMGGNVVVLSPADYQQWLTTGLTQSPHHSEGDLVSRGKIAFARHGCISCHEGNSLIQAPKLDGLYGSQVLLDTGESVIADDGYLRESILNPQAKIVAGYQNLMPPFQGQLNSDEVLGLIQYIKTLTPAVGAQQ